MARAAATSDVFNAIAEARRREIIGLLNCHKELAVGDLVQQLRMPQPAVSKHLSVLRKVGIATVSRRGKTRLYRLNAMKLKPLHDWAKTFEHFWDNQLGMIKKHSEQRNEAALRS
ncbi:MAG: helix-turn-helix transcriptional regulator [Verrucomicrobia bacterium]|nr:helix-turn-helix transcriptional regulator [Verrucomicrobiota bacterium]